MTQMFVESCGDCHTEELAAGLAAKRAGQAPQKRKRDDSSPPKNYRGPDQGGQDRFKEPKPRTELYRSRQTSPTKRKGRKVRQKQKVKNTKHIII